MFIPYEMLGVEADWKKWNGTDKATLIIKYGEETVEIGTTSSLNSFYDFSGSITFLS